MIQALIYAAIAVYSFVIGGEANMWCSGATAVVALWAVSIVFSRPRSVHEAAEEAGLRVYAWRADEVILKRVRPSRWTLMRTRPWRDPNPPKVGDPIEPGSFRVKPWGPDPNPPSFGYSADREVNPDDVKPPKGGCAVKP